MNLFNEAGDGINVRAAIEHDEDAYMTALEVLNDVIQGALHAKSMGRDTEENIFKRIRLAIRNELDYSDPVSLPIIE